MIELLRYDDKIEVYRYKTKAAMIEHQKHMYSKRYFIVEVIYKDDLIEVIYERED